MKKPKLIWVDTEDPLILAARMDAYYIYEKAECDPVLNEQTMDPIQAWCEQTNCGVRISFDMFRFKNQAQKTMFLLRWG
jgi:hypothetical protein